MISPSTLAAETERSATRAPDQWIGRRVAPIQLFRPVVKSLMPSAGLSDNHACTMVLIDSILIGAAGLLLIPSLVLFLECLCAAIPPMPRPIEVARRPSRAIVIPAHDEELTITPTIRSVMEQCEGNDRVIVVADNCSDRTAAICRDLGVEVVERNDTSRRGKGFALAAGVDSLSSAPPDVVVFFDADVLLAPRCIDCLAISAAVTERPSQAIYLLEAPAENPSLRDSISSLAFAVKNKIRPLGLSRLGLPVQLTGAGMAFPWRLLQQLPLASGNIVEDMRLGVDATLRGRAPRLVPASIVMGRLPSDRAAALRQRERWEQGHLRTIATSVPPLLLAGVGRGNLQAVALAVDLFVPPLSFLALGTFLAVATTATAAALGQSIWPLLLSTVGLGLIAGSIAIAWSLLGEQRPPLRTLLAIPIYIAWKIPLYFGAIFTPQRRWIRTKRD